MQKFRVNGQSVPKIEWKQMDGQTDGGDYITSHANAVGKSRRFSRIFSATNVTKVERRFIVWFICKLTREQLSNCLENFVNHILHGRFSTKAEFSLIVTVIVLTLTAMSPRYSVMNSANAVRAL